MSFAAIFAKAQSAIAMITEGRRALEAIKDTIADGKVALAANEQKQLNDLLVTESAETQAAYEDLKAAIAASRE